MGDFIFLTNFLGLPGADHRRLAHALPLLLGLLGSTAAFGAEIAVMPPLNGVSMIFVVGKIDRADGNQFKERTEGVGRAIVIMKSPGGHLEAAISIGAQIRIKQWATAVPKDMMCASACALAWLGGTRRYMAASSRIGFHAAYIIHGQQMRESGMANAIVGAYLNELGLPLDAIKFITSAAPDDIKWMTIREAILLGIPVSLDDDVQPEITKKEPETIEGTARRAHRNLQAQIKKFGMNGLQVSSDACYKRVNQIKTELSVRYCFMLDFIASEIDSGMAKLTGFPKNEFFLIERVYSRTNSALDLLQLDSSKKAEVLSAWSSAAFDALNAKSKQ